MFLLVVEGLQNGNKAVARYFIGTDFIQDSRLGGFVYYLSFYQSFNPCLLRNYAPTFFNPRLFRSAFWDCLGGKMGGDILFVGPGSERFKGKIVNSGVFIQFLL